MAATPARYEIRVEGALGEDWSAWFDGHQVASEGSETVISGVIADQSALHGLLNRGPRSRPLPDLGAPDRMTGAHRMTGTRLAHLKEKTMKLTIIAATGGVGRQLLSQALQAGHDVTAVARNPAKLAADVLASKAPRIVAADLTNPDPQALESAVAGTDAVLSALGPHNNADAGIAAPGTTAIITAMRAAGVRRIVAISAAPVATTPSPGRPDPPKHDPGDGFFMRQIGNRIANTLFGKVYPDLAAMEDVLRESGLDWTILRPPQLTDKPLTGRYRTAYGRNVRGGRSIPRADVAHYMLAVLGQPETIGQVIGIAA
jgi:uncharacterized protein YbjT (DUF2867 family)